MRRSQAAYWGLMIAAPFGSMTVIAAVGDWAGVAAGFGVFIAATRLAKEIWRRNATPEDIRRDLEDRA